MARRYYRSMPVENGYSKDDIVEQVADELELTKERVENVLNCALQKIVDAITERKSVRLSSFGIFEAGVRPERVIRCPRNEERKLSKETTKVKFRPGKKLIF